MSLNKVKILKDLFLIILHLVYFAEPLTNPTVHISKIYSLISLKPFTYILESEINVGLLYLFFGLFSRGYVPYQFFFYLIGWIVDSMG